MLDMDNEMRPEGQEHYICGVVKWFSPKFGYGFIVDEQTGADVFLGANELRDYGWETIAKGAQVEVWAISTKRGLRAYEISNVVVPSDIDERRVFDFHALECIASDYVPARVVWYDDDKGCGFASPYGDGELCFLHHRALAEIGLRSLNQGDVISVRIGRGDHGRVAACIRPVDDQPLPASHLAEMISHVAA